MIENLNFNLTMAKTYLLIALDLQRDAECRDDIRKAIAYCDIGLKRIKNIEEC